MGRLVKFSVGLVLALLVVIPLILGVIIRSIPDGFQPSLDRTANVDFQNTISETFRASKNNLSTIGLSIKNPSLLNKDPLLFNIYNGDQIIRSVQLSGANIPDGDFVKINFPPITDSQGNTYKIEFSAPDTHQNSLQPFISNQKTDDETLMINGQDMDGSISFVPYYKSSNPIVSAFSIYGNIFSQLGKDLGFAIIYILIIAGLLGYLLLI